MVRDASQTISCYAFLAWETKSSPHATVLLQISVSVFIWLSVTASKHLSAPYLSFPCRRSKYASRVPKFTHKTRTFIYRWHSHHVRCLLTSVMSLSSFVSCSISDHPPPKACGIIELRPSTPKTRMHKPSFILRIHRSSTTSIINQPNKKG